MTKQFLFILSMWLSLTPAAFAVIVPDSDTQIRESSAISDQLPAKVGQNKGNAWFAGGAVNCNRMNGDRPNWIRTAPEDKQEKSKANVGT